MPGLVDIAGRAVRYGLEPGVAPGRAVRDLVELAQGQGSLLLRAVGRVELGLDSSTSRAGGEVLALLDCALDAVTAPHTMTGLEAVPCASH